MWLLTEAGNTMKRTTFGFGMWTVKGFGLDRYGTSVHSNGSVTKAVWIYEFRIQKRGHHWDLGVMSI